MDIFSSLLCTSEPKTVKYKLNLFDEEDPISWAVNICRKHANTGALTLQAMESAFNNGHATTNDKALNFDSKNSKAVEGILTGIAQAYAGHARLEIIYADSVTGFCWYKPVRELYRELFLEALDKINPLGHYVQATLWFSASKHVYEAHTDLADGFLFQIAGKKRVKIWPLPDDFRDTAIYDNDATHRQSLPYQEFELHAGDVLFIPAGTVHEVTVNEGYTSLSLSFHLGGSYPLMALCNDLNTNHKNHEFTLKKKHKKTGKPYITLFNPAYKQEDNQTETIKISSVLCEKLCEVIQSGCSDDELAGYIENWWLDKYNNTTYKGPYSW